VVTEEIGHVELISTTIGMLLDGSAVADPPNKLPLNTKYFQLILSYGIVSG
jgi:Mn-containing catalase